VKEKILTDQQHMQLAGSGFMISLHLASTKYFIEYEILLFLPLPGRRCPDSQHNMAEYVSGQLFPENLHIV